MMTLFKARGVLPPGRVGEHDYAEISLEAGDFVSRVKAWTNGASTPGQNHQPAGG